MEYEGKLYGKSPLGYFDTGVTSNDYDKLVQKAKKLDEIESKIIKCIEEEPDTDLSDIGEIVLIELKIHI